MVRLVRLAVTRPKAVLAVAFVVLLVLGAFATTVQDRLAPSDINVSGSQASHWRALRDGHYGVDVVVLLSGPRAEIDRQGPLLVDRLRAMPTLRVLSPWDGPQLAKRLTFGRDRVLLTVDAQAPKGRPPLEVVPPLQRTVDSVVRPPVVAHLTGQPAIAVGLNKAVIKATEEAERIAFPILIIVLLLIFRSPIAAAIPLVVAMGTLGMGFGLIAIVASLRNIDAIALSVASMMGLALGVDYSLLIVSRFRENLEREGATPREAALNAGSTAGRTALTAGAVLIIVMSVPLLFSPGTILFSAALGAMVVAGLSMLSSVLVTPAILTLLGTRVNRWQIRSRGKRERSFLAGVGQRVARRPLVAAPLILLLLLLLAIPALTTRMDAPDVRQLPADNSARRNYEAVQHAVGPGWGGVLDVALGSNGRPLTDTRILSAVDRYQANVARLRDVDVVMGPGAVRGVQRNFGRLSGRLDSLGVSLRRGRHGATRLQSGLDRATRGAGKLGQGATRASSGASRLTTGAGAASGGANRLSGGAQQASTGAQKVHSGLTKADSGAGKLVAGLRLAQTGAVKLHKGASRAAHGAQLIADGLARAAAGAHQLQSGAATLADGLAKGAAGVTKLREPVGVAERELGTAFHNLELMTVGKADPRYAGTLLAVGKALGAISGKDPVTGAKVTPGYDGLDRELARGASQLGEAASGARRLAQGAGKLETGLGQLRAGAMKLAQGGKKLRDGEAKLVAGLAKLTGGATTGKSGLQALASGAGRLASGISQLGGGSQRLSGGLSRLEGGLSQLAHGLSTGSVQSHPLAAGLRLMATSLRRYRVSLNRQKLGQLQSAQKRTPGLFKSAYIALAALDGSRPGQRRLARSILDLDNGGEAGRVLVVPRSSANDPRTRDLINRLRRMSAQLARQTGIDAAVGGVPAEFADYVDAMKGSLPFLIVAIALLTFVGLVPIVRAIPLALVAVLLNLLTVGAAIGVLTIAFVGDHPPLGGPGAIDIVAISAIFAITFALSIDYEVFLLSRMREGYARSGDPNVAIDEGLKGTAHVVTGAAVIMLGVFTAFSLSDVVTISQFGIGLGSAVLLDATVIRLLLLPALMKLMGRSAWWMPKWLDRALPTIGAEAREEETRDLRLVRHAHN